MQNSSYLTAPFTLYCGKFLKTWNNHAISKVGKFLEVMIDGPILSAENAKFHFITEETR